MPVLRPCACQFSSEKLVRACKFHSDKDTEIDRLRGGIRHWLDVRMAGYTDKQYGKGELRALLNGAAVQPSATVDASREG